MQYSELTLPMVYPWQTGQWKSVQLARDEDRLPHALLLTGASGLGKFAFSLALSRSLLCQFPETGKACGHCHSCQLFSSRTHPDLQVIAPEEEGKAVKVDQIRDMIEKNGLTSHISSLKIHLILDADRMNMAASNSLLKTLEEPSPNTVIMLVTSSPEQLTATIKSRCQQIHFAAPDRQTAKQWLDNQELSVDPELLLSMTGGAPLTALAIDQSGNVQLRDEVFNDFGRVVFGKADPVKVASNWENHDLGVLLKWMTNWVIDMIRLKYNDQESIIDNNDKKKGLLKIASAFSLQQLFLIYQKQLQAQRLMHRQLNKLLLLESLLIPWVADNTDN